MFDLVVVSPIPGYGVGDRITDPAEIAAILADDRQLHVNRVAPLAEAAPEPAEPVAAEEPDATAHDA